MPAWSFSSSRLFQKCPRQWYYKSIIAEPRSKDNLRREAYLLSTLQTVAGWRGSLVDQVILMRYVPTLKRNQRVVLNDLIKYAKEIFQRQLEFGRAHRLREPGMKRTKVGDSFASFFDVEYGEGIAEADVKAAWADVEVALTNLANMRELEATLARSTHLFPQRSLAFNLDGIKATGTPDLLVFFRDEPPLIIDWKVHTFATSDYRLQLALYSLALTSREPHKDFPKDQPDYQATDVRLLEVQLLTNQQRYYHLTEEDIEAVSNYVARSALNMEMTSLDDDVDSIDDVPVTSNADDCRRCPFRSMCWK